MYLYCYNISKGSWSPFVNVNSLFMEEIENQDLGTLVQKDDVLEAMSWSPRED